MSNARIAFDHVPKTGGTALIQVFSEVLRGKASRVASGPHRLALRDSDGLSLLSGHFWYAPGERLSPNWYYATVLREPVDRFLSHFYFAAQDFDAADDYPAEMTRRLSLEDYLRKADPSLISFYSNVQARHFAALAIGSHQDAASLSEHALFTAAQAGLRSFSLVGVYPHLFEFVQRACLDLGLNPPSVIPKVNVTSSRPSVDELSEPVHRRLKEANRVDRELYWWAAEEFLLARPRALPVFARSVAPIQAAADFGSRELEVVQVICREPTPGVMQIEIECAIREPVGPFTLGIAVVDRSGKTVFGANTHNLDVQLVTDARRTRCFVFRLEGGFRPGSHCVTVALHRGAAHTEGCFHWKDEAGSFYYRTRGDPAVSCSAIKESFYELTNASVDHGTLAEARVG